MTGPKGEQETEQQQDLPSPPAIRFPLELQQQGVLPSASFLPCEVFISHPGTVKQTFAAHMHDGLKTAGVASFLDDDSLEFGCDAAAEMEAEVCAATVVVCVLTEDFFKREWPLQVRAIVLHQ